MTYEEAKKLADDLNNLLTATGRELDVFPRSSMGLVTDEAKASTEFKAAYAKYQSLFKKVREFNTFYCKQFKKEKAADRRNRVGI